MSRQEQRDSGERIRLNKYIANSGVCSRRAADDLIAKGVIQVNGETVTEVGTKVKTTDRVTYNGKVLNAEKLRYVLLNKPRDFITTMKDDRNRKTVMRLIHNACSERIYPVGRLDRNTTGLLLFTNDGELARKLTHPSEQIRKIYKVKLDKPLSEDHLVSIRQGTELEDGTMKVDEIAMLSDDRTEIGIEIHSGKNRIIRRLFAHYDYDVIMLDRVMFAGLTKKDLGRGKYRHLHPQEVYNLKHLGSD